MEVLLVVDCFRATKGGEVEGLFVDSDVVAVEVYSSDRGRQEEEG